MATTDTKPSYHASNDQNPISRDPSILSGTAVFRGTRVPVGILFEYLAAGDSIHAFMNQFPTVSQVQIVAVLNDVREKQHEDDNWYLVEDTA